MKATGDVEIFKGKSWTKFRFKSAKTKVVNLLLLTVALVMFILYNISAFRYNLTDAISCFDMSIFWGVPDITDDAVPPPKGRSIFFHETSCNPSPSWTIQISPRQACAVESAARLNPNRTVYLLYTSPIQFPNASDDPDRNERILRELLKYSNIRIRRIYLKKYTEGTPLEDWYLKGELHRSSYGNSHASDVLRYLSLWRYGGTYMDLDVIVMKNLDSLGYNYAGAESPENVASGVLNFDPENFGHEMADKCLNEIRMNFRGDDWGYNGPGVITRILKKTCDTNSVKSMNVKRCKGFKVLPPSAFYPIHWKSWSMYFDSRRLKDAQKSVKSSYAIHVWNKFSIKEKVFTKQKDVAYGVIAKQFCPNVYRESGDEF